MGGSEERRDAVRFAALFVLASCLLARSAGAESSFGGLGFLPGGTGSEALHISADGAVVVGRGSSGFGERAFRWTAAAGLEELGDLPGGLTSSRAYAVSDDGSVVVGESSSASGWEAYRWTPGAGMVGLGDLPGGAFESYARDVSGDGSIVVGGSSQAFRWTATDGMVGLGTPHAAYGVSGDGSVVVGGSSGSAYRWTAVGGVELLGMTSAEGVSRDGSVIVGSLGSAARWTEATGTVLLGDIPGGLLSSIAVDVSSDGSVIVGIAASESGQQAFVWDPIHGMKVLRDLLTDLGLPMVGWTLRIASGVSDDGRTIAGWGPSPGSVTGEAWRAIIPAPSEYTVFVPNSVEAGEVLGGAGVNGGIDIAFDDVTQRGALIATYDTETAQERSDCVAAGDCAPVNFAVPGAETQEWQLQFVGAFQGLATLVFRYDAALLGGFPETRLAVYHFVRGLWKRLTGTVSTSGDTITVTVPEADGFSPFVIGVIPACQDGEDNDGDTLVDLADGGCTDAEDRSEVPDCQDGLNNDSDGLVDAANDPGCTSPTDARETNTARACDDGIDNDDDEQVDYPADSNCASATGGLESPPVLGGGCGLGPELMLLAPLIALHGRLRRRRAWSGDGR
jgi:probable HAF family extracellular repeat protein